MRSWIMKEPASVRPHGSTRHFNWYPTKLENWRKLYADMPPGYRRLKISRQSNITRSPSDLLVPKASVAQPAILALFETAVA